MPGKRIFVLLACLSTLCWTGSAMASSAALNLIDTCLVQLHNTKQTGKIVLSNVCPQLSLNLDNPELAQLDPPLLDQASVAQLRNTQTLLRSLKTHLATVYSPQINNIHQILKQIYTPPKKSINKSKNYFDRIAAWLDRILKKYLKHDEGLIHYLNLNNQSQLATLKVIIEILTVILVVAILYLIAKELKAANVLQLFRRRKTQRIGEVRQTIGAKASSPLDLGHIVSLPLNQQIPALMRHCLHYLINKQILPRRYNLTNREFLAILREKLPNASRDFEQLVDSNERVVYGKQAVVDRENERLLQHVKNIEQLPIKVNG